MPLAVSLQGCSSNNLSVGLALSQGESVATQFILRSANSAINLTGYGAKMQINFATALLLTTGNGGITFPAATSGVMQINIADTVSEAFSPGAYAYDLWLISGDDSEATRLMAGEFTVIQSVTAIP